MGNIRLFFISGFFSITFYLLAIYFVLYFFIYEKVIDIYAPKKETVVEVSLVEFEKEINEKKPETKQIKNDKSVKTKSDKKPKKVGSKSLKEAQEFDDLFKNLDLKSKKVENKERIEPDRNNPASRKIGEAKKSDKTKSITSSIIKKVKKVKKITFINTAHGKFDPYFSQIAKILNKEWYDFMGIDKKARAKAIISIDNLGNFDYNRPYVLDRDEEFNKLLIEFLDKMKNKKFPPYKKGKIVKFDIVFGTI